MMLVFTVGALLVCVLLQFLLILVLFHRTGQLMKAMSQLAEGFNLAASLLQRFHTTITAQQQYADATFIRRDEAN